MDTAAAEAYDAGAAGKKLVIVLFAVVGAAPVVSVQYFVLASHKKVEQY